MGEDYGSAETGVEGGGEVEAEVDPQEDLGEEDEEEGGCGAGVDVGGKLAAAVGVSENIASDGEEGSKGLDGDVVARADDLDRLRRG